MAGTYAAGITTGASTQATVDRYYLTKDDTDNRDSPKRRLACAAYIEANFADLSKEFSQQRGQTIDASMDLLKVAPQDRRSFTKEISKRHSVVFKDTKALRILDEMIPALRNISRSY